MNSKRTTLGTLGLVSQGRWLLVLAVAALLLAHELRSAYAAATLTASENPVQIGQGQSTKTITLLWTLDAGQQATLTVKDNTQAVVLGPLSLVSPPTSGSQPLTVHCDKSYTATLVGHETNRNLAPPLQITVKCPGGIPPLFDPCLLVTCNKVTVTPDPHGMFANFHVTAAAKSSFQLQVGKQAPVNGQLPVVEKAIFNLAKVTSWDTQLIDLDAGAHYFYLVIATDEQGKKSDATGSFDTLRRVVKVSFTNIDMIDDSDSWGDCECTFGFWLNGTPITTWTDNDFAAGESKNPGVTHTVKPAGPTLTIRVAGWDDDNVFGGPNFCSWETNPSACGSDFAQGQKSYAVDISDLAGPIPPKDFWVPASSASLTFWVSGTYAISYAN